MDKIQMFIEEIKPPYHQKKVVELFDFIHHEYPDLELVYKWNQPMYLHHNVFIIAFSVSKNHIGVAIEGYAMDLFREQLEEKQLDPSKKMFRYLFDKEIDYDFLKELIDFKMNDRMYDTAFWR